MTDDILLTLFFTGFIAIGLFIDQRNKQLLQHGKKAKAVIFKSVQKSLSTGSALYYPVVRFKTDQDLWITKELDSGTSSRPRDGKQVEVIYDPEDPENVTIHSDFYLNVLPKIFISIGTVGLLIAVLELLEIINLKP
ncbi:DUF3592 domain-containing protein [Algoriphagus namhaensis]